MSSQLMKSKTLQSSDVEKVQAERFANAAGDSIYSIDDEITINPLEMLNEYIAVVPISFEKKGPLWTPSKEVDKGVVVGIYEGSQLNIGDIVQFSMRTQAVEIKNAPGYDRPVYVYSKNSLFVKYGQAKYSIKEIK